MTTVEEETADAKAALDALEPAARVPRAFGYATDRAALSQAISLRRIADALERLAALTDEQRAAVESYPADTPGQFVPYGASGHDFPWQDWPGGDLPPVPGDVRVEVKFRDGDTSGNAGLSAFAWQWRHTDHPRDIIAWCLAK